MQQHAQNDCGCRTQTADGVETKEGRRWFDQDAVAWLVGEGIRHLHGADEKAQLSYTRVVELLGRQEAATKTIGQLVHTISADDVSLRWGLLYLLAEVGDARASDVFFQVACEPIEPRERDRRACETPRDGEVLVRTMAIEGLAKITTAHRQSPDRLFRVIQAQPEPALRIEAVKAILAIDPGAADKLKELLPENLHFALTLKRVRAETLAVEFDTKERPDVVRGMPTLGQVKTTPTVTCGCR